MRKKAIFLLLAVTSIASAQTLRTKDFGLKVNDPTIDAAPIMERICDSARVLAGRGLAVKIEMEKGKYYFQPENSAKRTYYISNHDQDNPKNVGIPLENLDNVTLDGHGAELLFEGQMLPISLIRSTGCRIQNLSVDFPTPHIAQAEILDCSEDGITYRLAPWDKWTIYEGNLWTNGKGWQYHADYAIAFDGKTRHLVPETSDIYVHTRDLTLLPDSSILANGWKDERLKPGVRLAIRNGKRPTPGLFMADDVNTTIRNVKIHYCEGMGLLAQMCENIDIDAFDVCLRGKNDPRYFTSQADATHFSGCKGLIRECNSLYEGMMDDAINVHGTYLKVMKRVSDHVLTVRYMHPQCYGFRWGEPGDTIQFVQSKTMETTGELNTIVSINAKDAAVNMGVKEFEIRFEYPIPENINPDKGSFGIENLTWTPAVIFENNIIRNNRARGSLFSTPRKVIVRNNLFDHTSGCAILLCGDCNGWFETGACRDVLIEKNTFINALTNQFQFTNAIISIYPEIPDLENQKKYFHQNIRIKNNKFDTFDHPLLYAKSVDGLIFENNKIHYNHDFKPMHWNTKTFWLERVKNTNITEE